MIRLSVNDMVPNNFGVLHHEVMSKALSTSNKFLRTNPWTPQSMWRAYNTTIGRAWVNHWLGPTGTVKGILEKVL